MPALYLFGLKIDVDASHGYRGSIGALDNELLIQVTPRAGGARLKCSLHGELPLGSLTATGWTLDCQASAGVYLPQSVILDQGGSWTVEDLGFPSTQTRVIGVNLPKRQRHGITFGTDQRMLHPLLGAMIGGTTVTLDQESYANDSFWMCPDIPDTALSFEPKGEHARIYVGHFYDVDSHFESGQSVPIVSVRVTRSDVTVQATTSRLYVHGDLIDKRPATTSNLVLFQHALVNGELHFTASLQNPRDVTLHWTSASGSDAPPVLLALRWRDENGHPLAFQSERGSFTLTERIGFHSEVPNGSDADSVEFSNQTVGVTTDESVAWSLCSLDPVAHYRQVDEIHTEYGPVVLSPTAPREVHGLASGTVLRRHSPGDEPLSCEFTCERILDRRGSIIGWLPQIELGGQGTQWALEAFLEEQDSRDQHGVSMRRAFGKASATGPCLPLVDAMSVGVNLQSKTMDGAVPYQGRIVGALQSWLEKHDAQFVGSQPSWLEGPALPSDGAQTHRSGFALVGSSEVLGRVAAQLRTTAKVDELVLPSPRMQGARSPMRFELTGEDAPRGYVHGLKIDAGLDARLREIEERLNKADSWNEAWVTLMNQWVLPDPDIVAAVDEIRDLINVVSSLPIELPSDGDPAQEDTLDAWIALKWRAIDIAAMGDLDDIDAFDGEDLVDVLESMNVEEFAELCTDAIEEGSESPWLPLVRWLDAPVGPDLFRRVLRMLIDVVEGRSPLRYKKLLQACHDASISIGDLCDRLLGDGFMSKVGELLPNLAGILTELGLGENALLQVVREAWETNANGVFDALRGRFGPLLTDDLLDALADDAAAGAALLQALSEAGLAIYDLADIVRRPPEYLFATRRFASIGDEWDKALRLWSGSFGLASLAGNVGWNFFLGDSSSIIVKLGTRRSLEDILREAHARFASAERPDPLGLTVFDVKTSQVETGLAQLLKKLGPTLLAPSWTGLLILRPTADIGADLKIRDLCGFEYIEALYVAVAGRPLNNGSLDITAAIEALALNEAVEQLAPTPDDGWNGDVDFGLTRFSVMIRRSVLDAADIAFQLRVKNLLGSQHPDKPDASGVQTLTIRGTLPPADPGQPDKPRDLQFAAVLDPPLRVSIDVLCFDYVDFAALRVKLSEGKTYLDIDADLTLKNASEGSYPNFFESIETLKLNGFRIGLPSLEPGAARAIGKAIGLDFEWPSVEFSMPRARSLQLFGLEVTPVALGVLRMAGEEWSRFKASFLDIDNWGLPSFAGRKAVCPHVRFRASFGALPALGVAGKLSFDLVFGLLVVDGKPERPFMAIDGVAGQKITIDLFRLITITIEQLIFKRHWNFQLKGHPRITASGLVADQVELKILNWNPFGKNGKLSLANFHRTDDNDEYQPHGFVTGYEKKRAKDEASTKGFVKIHWVVLGQNIELPKKAYDYLLSSGTESMPPPDETRSLLTNLLDYQEAEDHEMELPEAKRKPPELVDGQLNATFTKNPNWLFAMSFSLGDILELGNLVLHDQHYYGIRLRDPRWVKAVFGQDTIEFAYIPGARRELDRFRTNLRLPFLDMLGPMVSGEVALEWAVNWDFLIDIGYPWKTAAGHNWFRAFSLPMGAYEAKFGFFLEKSTSYEDASDEETLLLGCGAAFYIGLYAGYGNSVAYVRAGIGIFGMFEGRFWLKNANLNKPETLLKATIVRMEVSGTIGIFAYAEGRIEVWILSASFRAWAEASLTSTIAYVPGATCAITYSALLAAGYSASVRVGSGWFSWTFRVSGTVQMPVSGRVLLA